MLTCRAFSGGSPRSPRYCSPKGRRQVAAVISAVTCVRCRPGRMALEEQGNAGRGLGPAPATCVFLVLVRPGAARCQLPTRTMFWSMPYPATTALVCRIGRGAADLLNAAGIPYCTGGGHGDEPVNAGRLAGARFDSGRLTSARSAVSTPRHLYDLEAGSKANAARLV